MFLKNKTAASQGSSRTAAVLKRNGYAETFQKKSDGVCVADSFTFHQCLFRYDICGNAGVETRNPAMDFQYERDLPVLVGFTRTMGIETDAANNDQHYGFG